MIRFNSLKKLCSLSIMLLLCGLISACGGGGGGGGSDSAQGGNTGGQTSGGSTGGGSTGGGSTGGGGSTTPPAATVTANLSWEAPGTRENGDKLYLYELGGYEIRYRASGEQDFQTITINDGETLEHQVANLDPGIYEFMVAAFDADGVYSDYSEMIAINLE